MHRSAVLVATALLLIAAQSPTPNAQRPNQSPQAPVFTRAPLFEATRALLPVGAVRPRGWLKRQLEIQAAGLTGHLHEIWPDVGPEERMARRRRRELGAGSLLPRRAGAARLAARRCPAEGDGAGSSSTGRSTNQQRRRLASARGKNTDWWPNFVMLKVLTQYHEVTGDPRVIPALQKYFAHHLAAGQREAAHSSGRSSAGPTSWSPCSGCTTARATRRCSISRRCCTTQGADWKKWYDEFPFTEKVTQEQIGLKPGLGVFPDAAMFAHGVNNAMALKTVRGVVARVEERRRPRTPSTARSTCSTATTRCRTGCSAPTSTTRAPIRRRASSSARWSRRCTRCSRC